MEEIKSAIQLPSVGRIVHYYPTAADSREIQIDLLADDNGDAAEPVPAIVTKVWNDQGTVNLQVFGNGFAGTHLKTSVAMAGAPSPGFWNWPQIK